MPLSELPTIDRLTLARVTAVPEWHPAHASFTPLPVHAWVVHHPDGVVLVDTGIGMHNVLVDQWYRPEVIPLRQALTSVRLEPADVSVVVLSHLHFDHCGQQGTLDAPVYVHATEHEAAQERGYTVPGWAAIPKHRLRLVHGEEEIFDGIRLLPTPGHTPGHQSVVVEAGSHRVVLAAQCAFRGSELRSGRPDPVNLHDDSWHDAAAESLARVSSLAPLAAQLSHDPDIVQLS